MYFTRAQPAHCVVFIVSSMFTGVVEPRFSGNTSASNTFWAYVIFYYDVPNRRRLHQNGRKGMGYDKMTLVRLSTEVLTYLLTRLPSHDRRWKPSSGNWKIILVFARYHHHGQDSQTRSLQLVLLCFDLIFLRAGKCSLWVFYGWILFHDRSESLFKRSPAESSDLILGERSMR